MLRRLQVLRPPTEAQIISSGWLERGGGNRRSSSAIWSLVSLISAAARFSAIRSGLADFGMAMTLLRLSRKASANCAEVTSRRGGHLADAGTVQQAALVEWRIGHQRHFSFFHPGHEIIFDAAAGQIVEHLIGGAVFPAGQGGEFPHRVGVEIRHAPGADFTGGAQFLEASTVPASGWRLRQCSR